MSETRPRANPGLWLGPLLALFGLLSYFTFFVRWPLFRDTAWLNLAILLGASAISLLALRRAWARGGGLRIGAGVAGLLVSLALTATLAVYCFVLSYELPEAGEYEGTRVPSIALRSWDGTSVDPAAAAPRSVLVFYRGFW